MIPARPLGGVHRAGGDPAGAMRGCGLPSLPSRLAYSLIYICAAAIFTLNRRQVDFPKLPVLLLGRDEE